MRSNFFSSVSSKIIAWLTVIGTVVAIITVMTMVDERYARADDVQKTQTQMLKTMESLNYSTKINSLQNQKIMLKMDKRALMIKHAEKPNDSLIKCLLNETQEDILTIDRRIGDLQNKRVIK